MIDLADLIELEQDDPELVPEILPVDARLSVRGPVSTFIELFERASSVALTKDTGVGSMYSLLEAFPGTTTTEPHARITATDGAQTVSAVVGGIFVSMAGAVLVPGKRVLEILKLAPAPEVRIDVLGSTATILSGRAQWTVQTPVGDALPPAPQAGSIALHTVLREPFLEAIAVARKAVASTAARVSLMQADIRDGHITGCDGARIHRQAIAEFPTDLRLSIPLKVLDELARMLKASDSEYFQIGADEFHLVFQIDEDSLIANRLLVRFPDVETLLLGPAFNNQFSLSVEAADLVDVVKRVRVNADPDYATISLLLTAGKKDAQGLPSWTMAVRARDRIGNTSQEILPVQWVGDGKPRELILNHKNLIDLLTSYGAETAVFKLGVDSKTVKSPLLLEDKDRGFMAVITQMRSGY